jgi:Mu-like prophage major head subunit gpT
MPAALTPSVLMDLESRMQVITEREYARLAANVWWPSITKLRGSTGRRDVIMWLLSTAQIRDQGKGGNIAFDDLVSTYTEIENKFSGAGLKLSKAQLTDTDGGGMDLAGQWSGDIGAYMAYWPQKQATTLLKQGHQLASAGGFTGYDKLAYFASGHPVNPFNTNAGTYANLLTGGSAPASGNTPAFPGACPIDDSVSTDVALVNMGKIFSYIASIRMPNGEDPRFLRPSTLLVPPRMFPRAVQLTSAKFLAQVASSGAGSADVEALIKALGFATPKMADELAGFESDTTFYVGCEQLSTSQLGAVIYTEREPFAINYYGTVDQAVLGRAQELEWQCHGRNVVSAGHPYLLFKCKGS